MAETHTDDIPNNRINQEIPVTQDNIENSQNPQVITLESRHFGPFLPLSLSRYQGRWFLTYPRPYGMTTPPGQRILTALNVPDSHIPKPHAKRCFWLNPFMPNSPYQPDESDYESKKYICSPIHILLDSEHKVAKLTGRTRVESSQAPNDHKKEIVCFEVEVLIPDEGLLRQCYHCLAWEADGPMERWKECGEDTFWCPSCQADGYTKSMLSGTYTKLKQDTLQPLLDSNSYPRDNLYSY